MGKLWNKLSTFNVGVFECVQVVLIVVFVGGAPLTPYITFTDSTAVVATLVAATLLMLGSFLFTADKEIHSVTFRNILLSGVVFFSILLLMLMRDGFPITFVGDLRFSAGTFVSFLSIFSVLVVGYMFTTSVARARLLMYSVVSGVLIFMTLFAVFSVFDVSFKAVGDIATFSTYLVIGVGFILASTLSFSSSGSSQLLPIGTAVLASIFIFFSGSLLLMFVTGVLVLGMFVFTLLAHGRHRQLMRTSTVFIVLIAGALVVSGMLVGSMSTVPLQDTIKRPAQEIRPSLSASIYVFSRVYENDPSALVWGTGLNSFIYQWDKYFPKEVSATVFWDKDFQSGSNMLITLALEIGLPLTLGIFLVSMFALPVVVRSYELDFEKDIYRKGFASIVVFGIVWMLLYPPSVQFLLVIGLSAGALIALQEKKDDDLGASPTSLFEKIVIVCLLGLSVVLVAFSVAHFVALYSHGKGVVALEENPPKYTEAIQFLEKATTYVASPETLRLLTYTYLNRARQEFTSGGEKESIDSDLSKAVSSAFQAQVVDSRQYQTQVAFGNAQFLSGVITEDEILREQAVQSFRNAQTLAPNRAAVQFNLAQAYLSVGNEIEALLYAKKALELRPQYEEVITFLETLTP
ncbi:MAG: tetratricopeptide repeat protein [Candidatus Pacebacteria bacterium]|nr:tetratricopeptide repeat protein [Candidatus Paceibacterota bacterium]